MTNINCSEKCIYQKDGKCSFENICAQKVSSDKHCSYFTKIEDKHTNIGNSNHT